MPRPDALPLHELEPLGLELIEHEAPELEPLDPSASVAPGSTLPPPAVPLPRYRRGAQPPPLLLQERDMALLEDVWRYRWLTTSQLQILRSCDERLSCRFSSRLPLTRRLKLLFHNRYVGRIARPLAQGSREPVYVLDVQGAAALSCRFGEVTARPPSQMPKALALDHLLLINQMRVSLVAACAQSSDQREAREGETPAGEAEQKEGRPEKTQLIEMLDWQNSERVKFSVTLQERGERSRKVTLIPDGFFGLRAGGRRLFFFVEVDLGTEPARTIRDKCRAYFAYWREQGFARDFGVPAQVGFRVLFVAPGLKRMETILKAAGSLEHGRAMFWATTEEHITPEQVMGPVFQDAAGATSQRLSGSVV